MCQFTSIRIKKQRLSESHVLDDVKPERQLQPNNVGFCYNPACLSNLPLVVACDQFAAQISLSHVSASHLQHLYLLQINKCLVSWQFFAAFCEANVCLCVCVCFQQTGAPLWPNPVSGFEQQTWVVFSTRISLRVVLSQTPPCTYRKSQQF